ncbi:DJ-1/PfpI family protein [Flavobacterium hydrophilum]|uniref:AraC family transcriptional regulator n=1 Tax=Flavobacterium hydrophilum TaxID=2211445 RepID=A0A2V4BX59_9FLAO|nr:DJ-1/PfpI family protein [Flavobacterium hydrophilum]PXY43585.1 AraC family transcriptional regulator [Flavobacterium hydrophilum]
MTNRLNVGIFIFNEVEVLDFAGPFEVFSIAENENEKLFKVITITENGEMIAARNGLKIQPNVSFNETPDLDILIIPGGYGAEEIEIKNKKVIEWIKTQNQKVKILASVCTGAFLLAEAGLLDHKKATTHWMDIPRLEKEYPNITVVKDVRFVDQNVIITSGGISSGINMSFHIIKKLYGLEIAETTAKRMEYDIAITA